MDTNLNNDTSGPDENRPVPPDLNRRQRRRIAARQRHKDKPPMGPAPTETSSPAAQPTERKVEIPIVPGSSTWHKIRAQGARAEEMKCREEAEQMMIRAHTMNGAAQVHESTAKMLDDMEAKAKAEAAAKGKPNGKGAEDDGA